MKTNSFLTKSLLLLAVLSITSLSTAREPKYQEKTCKVSFDSNTQQRCQTSTIPVQAGVTIDFFARQIIRGDRGGHVQEIRIKRGKKVVKVIKPNNLREESGTYKTKVRGRFSLVVKGTHSKSMTSLYGRIKVGKPRSSRRPGKPGRPR